MLEEKPKNEVSVRVKKKVSVGWRGISCNNCSMVFSHIDHAFSFQKEKKTMLFLFFSFLLGGVRWGLGL